MATWGVGINIWMSRKNGKAHNYRMGEQEVGSYGTQNEPQAGRSAHRRPHMRGTTHPSQFAYYYQRK